MTAPAGKFSGYRGDGRQLAFAWDKIYNSGVLTDEERLRVDTDFWEDFKWQSSKQGGKGMSNGWIHVPRLWYDIGAALDDPVLVQWGVDSLAYMAREGYTIDGVYFESCSYAGPVSDQMYGNMRLMLERNYVPPAGWTNPYTGRLMQPRQQILATAMVIGQAPPLPCASASCL